MLILQIQREAVGPILCPILRELVSVYSYFSPFSVKVIFFESYCHCVNI